MEAMGRVGDRARVWVMGCGDGDGKKKSILEQRRARRCHGANCGHGPLQPHVSDLDRRLSAFPISPRNLRTLHFTSQ
jgi:hypothetical protein